MRASRLMPRKMIKIPIEWGSHIQDAIIISNINIRVYMNSTFEWMWRLFCCCALWVYSVYVCVICDVCSNQFRSMESTVWFPIEFRIVFGCFVPAISQNKIDSIASDMWTDSSVRFLWSNGQPYRSWSKQIDSEGKHVRQMKCLSSRFVSKCLCVARLLCVSIFKTSKCVWALKMSHFFIVIFLFRFAHRLSTNTHIICARMCHSIEFMPLFFPQERKKK